MKKEHFQEKLPNGNVINYVRMPSGTCYHQETPEKVVQILERLMKERTDAGS